MSYAHFSTECHEHHSLVRDFPGKRPMIVVLCGSTKFMDAFRDANEFLTLEGHIVLSVGVQTTGLKIDPHTKKRLDELHLRKIDLADYVLVLNMDGYIGESTRAEIDYATKIGKPLRYHVSPKPINRPRHQ